MFINSLEIAIGLNIPTSLFTPGSSPAYLFEVVFVKMCCMQSENIGFLPVLWVLSGVIYNYSPPFYYYYYYYYSKSHFLQQRTVLLVT